jgi:hypothetical protein
MGNQPPDIPILALQSTLDCVPEFRAMATDNRRPEIGVESGVIDVTTPRGGSHLPTLAVATSGRAPSSNKHHPRETQRNFPDE